MGRGVPRILVIVGLGLVGVLTARPAAAFCRTTTVKTDASYDSVTRGCWTQGLPLFWRNACVGYGIARHASKKVAYDLAAELIARAFTRWTGATCPTDGSGGSRVSIDVRDLGPADCSEIGRVAGARNQNVVLFRDDVWGYDKTVLGLTSVQFNPTTGELYGADMEINMVDMDPVSFTDDVPDGTYDFLSVVTHEAGHFLGIAHSDVASATMYARYTTGQTTKRTLAPDDVNAICSVYRPNGDRAVFNGKVAAAPGCDPTPRGGYSPACQDPPGCAVVPGATRSDLGSGAALGLAVLGLRRLRRRRGPTSSRRRCRSSSPRRTSR